MSGAAGRAIPEPFEPGGIDETLGQDETKEANARERSSGRAETRLELPGYELQKPLGRGAYGEVWLAVQENTGREVAVKVFSRNKGLDWPLLKREVGKLVQVLSERRIVHLLAVGWDAEPPYYIMEYVRGGSLADRLRDHPMSVEEAVPLFREVAEALVYLHSKAILHCDLKPSNVLLDDRGQVRLADFGQARLSEEEGPPAGTLFYMAPEMTDPKARADVRSDIYSLGAMLFTMLTGKAPYAGAGSTRDLASTSTLNDRLQRYRDILAGLPQPVEHHTVAGVDKPLAAIIDRCLRRDPAERFSNVQQVLDALASRDRRRAQRPLIVLGALGPAVLLAGLFVIGAWAWKATQREADRTLTQQALDSNHEMARMVAAAVDYRLTGITSRVSKEAEKNKLVSLMTEAAEAGPGASKDLGKRLQVYMEALEEQYGGRTFFSWYVAGQDAYLWARSPFDAKVIGHVFADREWFNGEGNLPQAPPQASPRRATGLSLVYSSKAQGHPLVFSAASPIKSAGGAVLGVLAASVDVIAFNRWLSAADGSRTSNGCPSRFMTLINHRGQLLRHPCPRGGSSGGVPKFPVERKDFRDKPEVSRLLLAAMDESYEDLLRPGERYLAAAAELKENPGWYVIVQQEQKAALGPVHELTEQFDRLRWSAAAVGLVMVLALWLVLFRMIRAAPHPRAVSPAGPRP